MAIEHGAGKYGFLEVPINQYLQADKVTPALAWKAIKSTIHYSDNSAIIFDDSVLDKRYSFKIDMVRRQ